MNKEKDEVVKRLKEILVEAMELPRTKGRSLFIGDIIDRIDFLERHKVDNEKLPGLFLEETEHELKQIMDALKKKYDSGK